MDVIRAPALRAPAGSAWCGCPAQLDGLRSGEQTLSGVLAKARAIAAPGLEFYLASELGDRTADLVLCQHVFTVQTADELARKVAALLHFVNPNGLLWIVFKKEANKQAVDTYVARLPATEYVYILHGVRAGATHTPPTRMQRDAYLYLLLSRRAANVAAN